MSKRLVFVSYSKHDAQWNDRICRALGLLEHSDNAEIWSDDGIDSGSGWCDHIKQAIGRYLATAENRLDAACDTTDVRAVAFVAWGGNGKSTLVNAKTAMPIALHLLRFFLKHRRFSDVFAIHGWG